MLGINFFCKFCPELNWFNGIEEPGLQLLLKSSGLGSLKVLSAQASGPGPAPSPAPELFLMFLCPDDYFHTLNNVTVSIFLLFIIQVSTPVLDLSDYKVTRSMAIALVLVEWYLAWKRYRGCFTSSNVYDANQFPFKRIFKILQQQCKTKQAVKKFSNCTKSKPKRETLDQNTSLQFQTRPCCCFSAKVIMKLFFYLTV